MIIQLQPEQIASFWEGIKHGYFKANNILEKDQSIIGAKLLTNLFNGTHQAWLGFSIDDEGNKIVKYFGITSIRENELDGRRTLRIDALYGFRTLDEEESIKDYESIKVFARNSDCHSIQTVTSNPRIKELMRLVGMQPAEITYELSLEG